MASSPKRRVVTSAAALALAASAVAATAHAEPEMNAKYAAPSAAAMVVPDSYIVVLDPTKLPASAATAGTTAASSIADVARETGGTVDETFDALNMLTGTFTRQQLNQLMANPAVTHVEPNYQRSIDGIIMKDSSESLGDFWEWLKNAFGMGDDDSSSEGADTTDQADTTVDPAPMQAKATSSWGLDRIDQRGATLDGSFTPSGTGAGVHAYVIDTGILASHNEFRGRIGNGYDSIDGDTDPADCNGHGTHVAGTVAGSTYGVARSATIHAVRVLGCDGRSSSRSVYQGMNWVASNAMKPAVVNMSLGGPGNNSDDAGVRAMVAAGLTVVVAAGNESTDACRVSPSREPVAITVASSTKGDGWSSFSNYGRCVDIIAPGSQIVSANHRSPSATNSLSGTSMASPHVAGAAALYLGKNPSATPQQVTSAILGAASNVSVGRNGTPNKMLYVKFDGQDANPQPNPVQPQPNPGGGAQPQPNPGVQPQPNPGGGVQPQPNPGGGVQPQPQPNPGVQPQPQPQPNPGGGGGGPVILQLPPSPDCGWFSEAVRLNAGEMKTVKNITMMSTDRIISCIKLPPQGVDADLYVQMQNRDGSWATVAKASEYVGVDQVVMDAPPGKYRFKVHAVSGSGMVRFGYSRKAPN